MSEQQSQTEAAEEQPLVSHLVELRDRILRSLLIVLVIFLALFSFSNEIYEFVSAPLTNVLPEGTQMIATEVASPFFAPFKLTMFTAIFIAMPFLLHQAWGFIAPGLYKTEIKVAFPILLSSIILFYTGVAFAYFAVLGFTFAFFTQIGPDNVAIMTDISSYLDFVLLVFFAFGICFEIPIATILLVLIGVVSPASLAEKRPFVIVGCFVIAMFLTPTDPFSLLLLAIPMCLLYEVGILAARLVYKKEEEDDDTKTPK